MSIMGTLFGQQAPAQTGTPPAEQPTGNPTPAGTPPAEGTTPPTGTPPAKEGSASPLADYGKMWETSGNEANKAPSFTLDRKAVGDMAGKINFGSNITKEQLASIANGGEEAIASMMAVLNSTAQNAFINSTETTGHLIANAMERNNAYVEATIPTQIKKATVSNSLAEENPGFADPAVAPMVQLLEKQLATQFPNASAADLTAHAQKYLSGLAGIIAPQQEAPKQSKQEASQDFSNY